MVMSKTAPPYSFLTNTFRTMECQTSLTTPSRWSISILGQSHIVTQGQTHMPSIDYLSNSIPYKMFAQWLSKNHLLEDLIAVHLQYWMTEIPFLAKASIDPILQRSIQAWKKSRLTILQCLMITETDQATRPQRTSVSIVVLNGQIPTTIWK